MMEVNSPLYLYHLAGEVTGAFDAISDGSSHVVTAAGEDFTFGSFGMSMPIAGTCFRLECL